MEITVRPVTADIRFAEAPGDMQSANFRTPANIIILVLAGFGAIALVFYVYHYFETKKDAPSRSIY
jgi:hypothetical protein